MASRWDPWRGCHKCSDGCLHCYIHKGDAKRGVNTDEIVRAENFSRPIQKKKNGEYKMASGLVWLCFASDFLIEEADPWRAECWQIIKERRDCTFVFLTKRISRFMDCIPEDWGNGYENVVVCCTIENQKNADEKLAIFQELPIRHKQITAQPLIEDVDLEKYLGGIECVTVGGESDKEGRLLDYRWVTHIREQCVRANVSFSFRQCGTHFCKDGKLYTLPIRELMKQARLANIDYDRQEPSNPSTKEEEKATDEDH